MSASAIDGDTVTFTVNTRDIQDGTTVGYTISGIESGDLSAGSLTGNFTINSNTGTVNVTLANDVTTEGSEIMTLTLAATDSEGTTTNGAEPERIQQEGRRSDGHDARREAVETIDQIDDVRHADHPDDRDEE